jgi:hypothetical protein
MLFIAIGELLIRFDEAFHVMEENKLVKIEASLTITPEFSLLKNDGIDTAGNNFRVMVLGDSYINGGGIEFKDNFSQQLKLLLQTHNRSYKDIYVLDVSKPSSNNFDNVQTYFQFVEKYKPDAVVLGYNYNDAMGNLDKEMKQTEIENFEDIRPSTGEKQTLIKRIYDIIYQSRFVFFVLHNLHDELKTHGIVFPNSSFSLMLNDYSENHQNWIRSKSLLQTMIDDAKKRNIRLYVLRFPEINLLEYPKLFSKADATIERFFTQPGSTIHYVNGTEVFKGESSKDNILSKYDGHPNERAHKKMANALFTLITNENEKFTK